MRVVLGISWHPRHANVKADIIFHIHDTHKNCFLNCFLKNIKCISQKYQ